MSLEYLKTRASYIAFKLFFNELIEAEVIGLGTGSTVKPFIDLLIKEGVLSGKEIYVSSSDTLLYLRARGLNALMPDPMSGRVNREIDIYVDGFDEASRNLVLIKGRGGAFHLEKVLAKNSEVRIYIADYTKWNDSNYLYLKPIPVEVVKERVLDIYSALESMGLKPRIRVGSGRDGPVITDGGNYIIDIYPNIVRDPAGLEAQLMSIGGVIDTGIFLPELVDHVVIAGPREWEVKLFTAIK